MHLLLWYNAFDRETNINSSIQEKTLFQIVLNSTNKEILKVMFA